MFKSIYLLFFIPSIFCQDPPDPPTNCSLCLTGECATCNDPTCWHSKTGECEKCWIVDEQGHNCMNCSTCWLFNPCSICETGGCRNCTSCTDTKEGKCAYCWNVKDPLTNLTCLADDSINDCRKCWNPDSPPVIFIPGLTETYLNATYSGIIPACILSKQRKSIWPVTWNFTGPLDYLCYADIMHLHFDNSTKTFKSPKHVNIYTYDFGGMDGIGFGSNIESFLSRYGWKIGKNLFGAPFDWRYISDGLDGFYKSLKLLIEGIYIREKQKVSLISISYGPQIALGFLHRMTFEWKDKYINWWMAESPVWSGSVGATISTTVGYPFPLLPQSILRTISTQIPATLWLQPRPGNDKYSYTRDEIIVMTPSKNYSAWDLAAMFEDLGLNILDEYKYLRDEPDLGKFAAPLVNTFVAYGYGLPTPDTLLFDKDFTHKIPPQPYKILNISGDGIVAVKSSLRSMLWKEEHIAKQKKFVQKGYAGQQHAGCIIPYGTKGSCFFEVIELLINGIIPEETEK